MGLKHSKSLKEKLGGELTKSSTTSPKDKKMSFSSPSPRTKIFNKKPNPLPPDRDIPSNIGNFNRKHDKLTCPAFPELFENEDQSDVTFLVGMDGWRFPGHKHVLAPASPVFRAMLEGPLSSSSTKEEIPIEDVEPRAFENILRFIYIGDVKLLTIQSTLDTLYATDKYMLPELTRLCLEVLEFSLSVNNVLAIHHGIHLYCSVWSSNQDSDDKKENGTDKGKDNPQHDIPLLHTLQNRCLELIDSYAEQVLTCEDFDSLSPAEVSQIVFRDTLQVNSEVSVSKALHRWTIQQCKRNQMAMTWTNKRDCLKETLYAVRYLLMTKEEFVTGQGSIELLTQVERDWLLAKIVGRNGDDLQAPPTELVNAIRNMERRRGGYSPTMAITGNDDGRKENGDGLTRGQFGNPVTTTPFVDPWCNTRKKPKDKKQCCKASNIFTECLVCFSLLFD